MAETSATGTTAVTGTTPAAAPPAAPAETENKPPKIKVRKPRQRACDEKDDKGKFCFGHLKRWYDYPKEIEALVGKKAEIYRCEFCKTIYKPNTAEMPQSYTLRT
ncbi:MAG TPA: hypothetical protein VKR82_14315 [Candidatus Acidoferrales bacterium]|nr:hypothetical protein [Candidatus Acidoferrales bacterium]